MNKINLKHQIYSDYPSKKWGVRELKLNLLIIYLCIFIFLLWTSLFNLCHAKTGYTSHRSIYLGVIDQIDFPWLVITSESGETLYVSLSHAKTLLREGEWVIYVKSTKMDKHSIYPLNPPGIRQFKHMMSQAFQEHLNRLKQYKQDSSSSFF